MGRIEAKFAELSAKGAKALISFITAGDPNLAVTEDLIPKMAAAGADIIELGMPFSDPMADGPTIQKSSERALAAGTTLPAILETVANVRQISQVPIVLMGYFNPILQYGIDAFAADAVVAGVDGVLLVDLPPEESAELRRAAERHGLDLICLLTPTSDASRISTVSRLASGFVYYVSVTGVTGARSAVADSIPAAVARIRERIPLPVVVGFGISTPAQAGEAASAADGAVVGSALVKLFEEHSGEELSRKVTEFVAELKSGL